MFDFQKEVKCLFSLCGKKKSQTPKTLSDRNTNSIMLMYFKLLQFTDITLNYFHIPQ